MLSRPPHGADPQRLDPDAPGVVSTEICSPLLSEMARRGQHARALVEDAGCTAFDLADPSHAVSWNTFTRIWHNAGKIWSDQELREIGGRYLDTTDGQALRILGRYFFAPVEFYRWLALSGPYRNLRCMKQTLIESDRDRLVVQIRMAAGHPLSREFLLARQGFLAQLPRVLGLPPAVVRLTNDEDEARFVIDIPAGCGALAWMRRTIARPFSSSIRRARDLRFALEQARWKSEEGARRIRELEERAADLQRSEELFTQVFQSAPVAMIISRDDTGAIVSVNDKFVAVSGFEVDEVIGRTAFEVGLWPGDEQRDEVRTKRDELRGSVRGMEVPVCRKDGRLLIALLSTQEISFDGRQCTIWHAIDVTEQFRAQEEIRLYRDRLEERVAERSLELDKSREQLRHSDRLASIGTLAAGIAHQINNPVGSIRAAAEFSLMMDDDEAAEIWRESMRDIIEQADRCTEIVKSVLHFSRGESAPRSVQSLISVLAQSRELVIPYADQNSATITLEGMELELYARINQIEVEQVLVNVLRNAVESDAGASSVTIRLARSDGFAEIEVEDDGPGVEPKDISFLFDPFYTTRLKTGGTGLGLSVAHGIIANHGGSIKATSKPGEGTRIIIRLPLVDPDPDASSRSKRLPPAESGGEGEPGRHSPQDRSGHATP